MTEGKAIILADNGHYNSEKPTLRTVTIVSIKGIV